jgi:hypothetical protein
MTDPYALGASIMTLYTWGGVAALVLFLFAIARFYEHKAGRRSFFPLFLVPMLAFAGSAVRYAIVGDFVGDWLADAGRLVGSVLLCGLGYHLLSIMMGGR